MVQIFSLEKFYIFILQNGDKRKQPADFHPCVATESKHKHTVHLFFERENRPYQKSQIESDSGKTNFDKKSRVCKSNVSGNLCSSRNKSGGDNDTGQDGSVADFCKSGSDKGADDHRSDQRDDKGDTHEKRVSDSKSQPQLHLGNQAVRNLGDMHRLCEIPIPDSNSGISVDNMTSANPAYAASDPHITTLLKPSLSLAYCPLSNRFYLCETDIMAFKECKTLACSNDATKLDPFPPCRKRHLSFRLVVFLRPVFPIELQNIDPRNRQGLFVAHEKWKEHSLPTTTYNAANALTTCIPIVHECFIDALTRSETTACSQNPILSVDEFYQILQSVVDPENSIAVNFVKPHPRTPDAGGKPDSAKKSSSSFICHGNNSASMCCSGNGSGGEGFDKTNGTDKGDSVRDSLEDDSHEEESDEDADNNYDDEGEDVQATHEKRFSCRKDQQHLFLENQVFKRIDFGISPFNNSISVNNEASSSRACSASYPHTTTLLMPNIIYSMLCRVDCPLSLSLLPRDMNGFERNALDFDNDITELVPRRSCKEAINKCHFHKTEVIADKECKAVAHSNDGIELVSWWHCRKRHPHSRLVISSFLIQLFPIDLRNVNSRLDQSLFVAHEKWKEYFLLTTTYIAANAFTIFITRSEMTACSQTPFLSISQFYLILPSAVNPENSIAIDFVKLNSLRCVCTCYVCQHSILAAIELLVKSVKLVSSSHFKGKVLESKSCTAWLDSVENLPGLCNGCCVLGFPFHKAKKVSTAYAIALSCFEFESLLLRLLRDRRYRHIAFGLFFATKRGQQSRQACVFVPVAHSHFPRSTTYEVQKVGEATGYLKVKASCSFSCSASSLFSSLELYILHQILRKPAYPRQLMCENIRSYPSKTDPGIAKRSLNLNQQIKLNPLQSHATTQPSELVAQSDMRRSTFAKVPQTNTGSGTSLKTGKSRLFEFQITILKKITAIIYMFLESIAAHCT